MAHHVLESVLLLLALSIGLVWLLRRAHLPPILGYLIVGVAVGPHAAGWIGPSESLGLIAEIGVVLLLFMIGMEFSLARFIAMRRVVLGLGGAQVAVSTLVGAVVIHLLGFDWRAALIVAGAMALSSTAIAVRQLGEQFELQSRHGRAALGVLLFQDLAVVPFLVVLPILAGDANTAVWGPVGIALLKGAAAFALMLAIGHWLLPPFLHQVASARSAELFTLAALVVALAAAWATQLFGLSLALGAFLAGMMLGESAYQHQIETDIRPFRDVMMAVFFITVGMQLDVPGLASIWREVTVLVVGILLGKAILISVLARMMGEESGVAVRTGLVLAQGGEFGFALLALALQLDLLFDDEAQIAVASILISMLIAPFLIRHNGAIAKRLFGSYLQHRREALEELNEATHNLAQPVIVCRYGWTGQHLTRFLESEGIEVIALDLDPARVRSARTAGEPVFYADYTHPEVLMAAGVDRATAVVLTSDELDVARRIIAAVRRENQTIPIIVRSRNDADIDELTRLGADEVVPENIEGSMTLATHVLHRLGFPADDVLAMVELARARRLQARLAPFDDDVAAEAAGDLVPFGIDERSPACGQSLAELQLDLQGVRVHAIERGGIRGYAPTGALRLRAGDVLILEGSSEGLTQVEERLRSP